MWCLVLMTVPGSQTRCQSHCLSEIHQGIFEGNAKDVGVVFGSEVEPLTLSSYCVVVELDTCGGIGCSIPVITLRSRHQVCAIRSKHSIRPQG